MNTFVFDRFVDKLKLQHLTEQIYSFPKDNSKNVKEMYDKLHLLNQITQKNDENIDKLTEDVLKVIQMQTEMAKQNNLNI